MKIIEHIPNFVACDAREAEFNTLDELMEVPWVKQWSVDKGGVREETSLVNVSKNGIPMLEERTKTVKIPPKKFHRFSMSDNMLIVEYNNGDTWYVIGDLDGEIDLPQWEYPREKIDAKNNRR